MKFILGKKIEMTQMFGKNNEIIPITLIEAGPCFVLQVKTKEKDGYEAIQIGFEKKDNKKLKKSEKAKPYRHLREFRTQNSELGINDKIDVSIFEEGDKVKISGKSKGKGFQGGVKKWGFHGRPSTHGTKHEERTIGSIGSAFPQRVIKGKKMPGRMGFTRISVKNLKIAKLDIKNNIIAVKGAVPGRRGTLLEITSAA